MALGDLTLLSFIMWSRCRQLRRHLTHKPGEVDRILRLLDYESMGSPGPIHLRIDSALFPPRKMMTG